MTTQYTPILALALPVTGELSGTWGDVVNDNITSMVEQAIAGLATINTWAGNGHTLTTANGTTSESRCAMLVLTDTGVALTGAATVICPTASKIYIVKNTSGQSATITTAAGTGVSIPNGETMFVFCDGTNVVQAVTRIASADVDFAKLKGTGAVVVTNILDEDNMASDSATALATQQSIKAYVDSQIAANNDLSEVLANGNTTGGTDIVVSTGDSVQVTDLTASVAVFTDASKNLVSNAITGTGNVVMSTSPTLVTPALGTPASGVVTNLTGTASININGTVGASTPSTGAFTTLSTSGVNNLAGLTASTALALDVSKNVVSVANTGTGSNVLNTSPTLVTPALGTPASGVMTNVTGTAAGLTAGNTTTNANLTGAVTSVGNAASLGSFTSAQLATALTDETGTGANVFATSPTLVTPALGTPSSGVVTNLTGTASININGTVGASTPSTGAFTTLSASGTSTLAAVNASGSVNLATGGAQVGIGATPENASGIAYMFEVKANPSSTQLARFNTSDYVRNTSGSGFGIEATTATGNSAIKLTAQNLGNGAYGELQLRGSTVNVLPAGLAVGAFSSTGLAVTGAISASGAAGTSFIDMAGAGNAAPPAGVYYGLFPQATFGLGLVSRTDAGIALWAGATPVQRATISSTGLAVTGAISATEIISANKGITFPATQVASADANTLDDYEEGTWTPSIGGDATYSGQNGRYTKIGNLVTVQFVIEISTKGTGSATLLSGLPFAANIGTVQTGCVSYFNGIAVSVYFLAFYIENAATTCLFVSTNSITGSVVNGAGVFGNGATIHGAASYYVS